MLTEPLEGPSFPVGRQGTGSWIFKGVIQAALALWPLPFRKPAGTVNKHK